MKQEIIDEVLEQLELDIKFGFENQDELFESIREMFADEDDFDEDWLEQTIAEKYEQHKKLSLSWSKPTDFGKLAASFDQLIREKVVCLHKAGFTKQDGESDCMQTINILNERGVHTIGYCYYHSQDLERAIDEETKLLYLGFDSVDQDDDKALEVANRIVAVLKQHGLEVHWTGTIDHRIEIRNIHWQKIPDNDPWGPERVLSILSQPAKSKKPFWKFW